MSSMETIPTEALGPPDETCVGCGAPLVPDQRYCLECGERRGAARVPFAEVWLESDPIHPGHHHAPAPQSPAPATRSRFDQPGNATLLAGVGCLLLALLIGVLIGRAGRDGGGGTPQVVTVAGSGAATGGTAAAAAFKDDWPAGKKGFTVELQALPKDGTDAAAVAAAKSAATGKGATAVGALDSDSHASLDGGSYVVYSGLFPTKAAADKELAKLKGDFPDAQVVEVSDSGNASSEGSSDGGDSGSSTGSTKSKKDLESLQGASPEEYQKKSAKLPKQVATPGKPPPKDNKKAGGGSDEESFE